MTKDFRSRGVPLDGIGFQPHVNLKFDDPRALSSFAANLKRFRDLGMGDPHHRTRHRPR
jgi:endo-1,4-beta-xylanase